MVTVAQSKRAIFQELLAERGATWGDAERTRVERAYADAERLYAGQSHWMGEPMLEHCVSVLNVLKRFEPDDDTIIACLLHHTLDAKQWTLGDIEKRYGSTVRSLVSGVYLLSYVTMKDRRMSVDHLRLLLVRMAEDIRVLLLILCNRMHALDHLHTVEPEEKRRLCSDALTLFAPVSARLGIYAMKHDLEAKAFPVLYPINCQTIDEQLRELHERYGDFLPKTATHLQNFLREQGVAAEVMCREKAPFSIFRKMQQKSMSSVEDLHDLFALRVLVPTLESCYQTLGLLHRIGYPMQNRFRDYIAFPKPNGYQSLHTTLAKLPGVPEGLFVEVQIRTPDMHRESEFGVAAHWQYKQGSATAQTIRRTLLDSTLLSEQGSDLAALADHIFVLTPKGDIIELPDGATPLDFAFHVHTNVGLAFRACKVNGVIVPMDHALENGDVVEILKNKEPRPSPKWIALLKTASARARLKRYLVAQERPMYVAMGKEILNDELLRRHLPPLDREYSVLSSFDGASLSLMEREDLLVKLGQGSQSASSLFPHLAAKGALEEKVQKRGSRLRSAAVHLEDNVRMPVKFARCCKPDVNPCTPITGIVTREGEVRVHCTTCKMLKKANPERRISVWREGA